MLKTSWHLLIVLVLVLSFSCTTDNNDEIVARVGDYNIYYNDFIKNFERFPRYQKGMTVRDARMKQLEFEIEKAYNSLAGYEVGIHLEEDIQKKMNYIYQKEILAELYLEKISNKVKISEDERREAFRRLNLRLKARHLLFNSQKEAEVAREMILSGKETFTSLAKKIFKDPRLRESGGLLGLVSFGDTDPEFENAMYSLKKGEISTPVKTKFGYHLIQIDEIQYQVFRSDNEYQKAIPTIDKELRIRKEDSLAVVFLKSTFPDVDYKIKSEGLNALRNALRLAFSEFPLDTNNRSTRPPLILPEIETAMKNVSDEPLIEFNNYTWTVKDFLEKLKYTSPFQRPNLRNSNILISTIVQLARNQLLFDFAVEEGYGKRKNVLRRVERWQRLLVAEEFKKRYMLKSYKNKYPEKWNKLYSTLTKLKNEMKPVINEQILLKDVDNPDMKIKQHPAPVILREMYVWPE
ncbi:MAG: hypothetical protein Kow00108_07800 [Calditrichia bacterium]